MVSDMVVMYILYVEGGSGISWISSGGIACVAVEYAFAYRASMSGCGCWLVYAVVMSWLR